MANHCHKCFNAYFSHYLIKFISFGDRYMAYRGLEWSQDDLDKTLSLENVSIRTAALTYNFPKSTLHDHYSGKVKGSKRGPSTVLSDAEELKLVEWAVEMTSIGYGRTREQISEMVKRLPDEDGRPNPFVNNYPSRASCYPYSDCIWFIMVD